MKKAMETVQDLIEEAKIRTVWWALCIFSVSYLLTHTSKSMWMNVPISVLIVCGLRILCNEVEFRWKVRNIRRQTYLSHLEKKQLSVNDSRLSTTPPPPKWKRKIDSPVVEAAMDEFVNKILQDFVVDLWYSDITPDKEAPELIHAVVMDVLGEVSGRVKEINLVELLTRDIVDLIGKNLDLFRRNQAAIGMEVMGTLSSEERDERLKHHLLTSKDLHPALISSDCEYKVLQRLTGGLLAVALRPREAQCPLIRCIARELLTCLVMQPLINLASPAYINELIEHILLALKDVGIKQIGIGQSPNVEGHKGHHVPADQHHVGAATNITTSHNKGTDLTLSRFETAKDSSLDGSGNFVTNTSHNEAMHPRSAEWARVLEAATQRRTEVLMPENLENMWAIGRNYKKKVQKLAAGSQPPLVKGSDSSNAMFTTSDKEILANKAEALARMEDEALTPTPPRPPLDSRPNNHVSSTTRYTPNLNKVGSFKGNYVADESENSTSLVASGNKNRLTRSSSTPDLNIEPEFETDSTGNSGGPVISEFYNKDLSKKSQALNAKSASNMVLSSEGQHTAKLRCRVVGAYFEKLGSKSFAVYSIAVTDINGITWFVKRRYRNFERLHRQLKDIPNYSLHLPPKRIFSSSTEDAFVHQRCIQLDKYLQDLLSIANVAEQHEVWDFLSVSSKNYSFGKSPSVMKSLAVNVDDAMDDIVRQFKGVSDGLMRKVASPSSSVSESASSLYGKNLSLKEDEINKLSANSVNSFSDNEEGDKSTNPYGEETGSSLQTNGWHSDTELNSKEFPPRVVKRSDEFRSVGSDEKDFPTVQSELFSPRASRGVKFSLTSEQLDDPIGVPPEWTPPNLSVPLLNLVDNVFQLNRRGWLRRQVFWISKQILQLMMEDAIDDWLLMQIHWLRREDTIAQGIRWIQDVLWPGGKFFLKLNIRSKMDDNETNDIFLQSTSASTSSNASKPGSFELQLEAARRASNVKKMILSGAPTALVSLIGHKQYKRCARDIYYFIQSTVCLKQVTYEILELVLVSIFPEMRDVVLDMHEKMRAQPL
ncbi:Phox homologous domain [Heracleum sosnowskyi]|uniref:Phox homologous domain n=1 Tax=Heracleum sosnowskyi TaxID=360622 RepID=A0AAD8HM20_9APIA|nr:Phox homologous domain [Heracleum sosnowskyi]